MKSRKGVIHLVRIHFERTKMDEPKPKKSITSSESCKSGKLTFL